MAVGRRVRAAAQGARAAQGRGRRVGCRAVCPAAERTCPAQCGRRCGVCVTGRRDIVAIS